MATVTLDYSVTINNEDGQSASFVDNSVDYGVGSNLNYSDIKAVRFYRGNYIDDQNPVELNGSGEMDQYREYQSSTLAPFTYDSKIVPLSGRFIPFITGVNVQANSIMTTTGRYSPYINPATYLPLVTQNVLTLIPSDFGLTDTIFPDRVYYGQYEVYIDSAAPTNVVEGNTYIVYGGSTATCAYNGSTYRPGEVFVASDNGAVVFTNGGSLKIMAAAKFKYFCLTWNIEKTIVDLQVQALTDQRYTEELQYKIAVVRAKLAGITRLNIMNWTSAQLAQNTISDITNELTVINNWYNA